MKHLPFLALLLPTLLFAQTAKWDGTTRNTAWYTSNASADTFTISTAEQLAGLAQLVNRINNPVNFSGKTILLANDIDLGEKSWTPIGNSTACTFQGIFDGQSHVISGLHVSDAYYAGLFGRVNGAEIKDVGVSGDVYGTGNYTGGLVGQMYGGSSITGSYASGDVYGTGDCTGGLVGSMS
ncbi:MAG: hypothetical protein FWC26_00835, partial [Fibromonadales bacterium]|nr:hypothetical protein [Fibromonadales bacterium]